MKEQIGKIWKQMVELWIAQARLLILILLPVAAGIFLYGASPLAAVMHNPEYTLYISPTGKNTNPGSAVKPLATLDAARDVLRESGKLGKEPCQVVLQGGIYRLKNPFRLTPEDSGTEIAPVIYRAAEGAEVTVTSAQKLDLKWEVWKGSVYRAKFSSETPIDQLFINNQQQIMARYPNRGAGLVIPEGAKRAAGKTHKLVPFHNGAAQDAWNLKAHGWANPEGAFLHGMHNGLWGGVHFRVLGIKSGELDFKGGWQNNRSSGKKAHRLYRMIENVFEELDAPGEWYFDQKDDWLYYYAADSLQMDSSVHVEAVFQVPHLIEIYGSLEEPAKILKIGHVGNSLKGMTIETPETETPVRHIHIRGIRFTGTARTFMKTKEPLLRSDWTIYRGGAVHLRGTGSIVISDCYFHQLGGNAIFVDGYNRKTVIRSCLFQENSATDINFVGSPGAVRNPAFSYQSPRPTEEELDTQIGPRNDEYPADGRVEDCLSSFPGRIEKQAAGINISMSSRITLRHNTIHHTPRAAINICDGTWGGHIIEWNDCFETVLETHDHGAFNSWGRDRFWFSATPSGPRARDKNGVALISKLIERHPDVMRWDAYQKSIIRNNRMQCDYGWDIDLDDGSTNYEIYNNLCLRGGIKTREGYYRNVYNNILIGDGYTCNVPYPKPTFDVFEKNILWGGTYRSSVAQLWGGVRDRNFFHNPEFENTVPATGIRAITGDDANSLVGNALFVDPAFGNFSVEKNSPALDLGFKNFPMDRFGVVSEDLRSKAPQPEFVLPQKAYANTIDKQRLPIFLGAKIDILDTEAEMTAYGAQHRIGVILVNVPADSPMARYGFETDDVILFINNQPALHQRALQQAMTKKGKYTARILRGQSEIILTFTK